MGITTRAINRNLRRRSILQGVILEEFKARPSCRDFRRILSNTEKWGRFPGPKLNQIQLRTQSELPNESHAHSGRPGAGRSGSPWSKETESRRLHLDWLRLGKSSCPQTRP